MVFDITRRDFLLVNAMTSIAVLTARRDGQELSAIELRTLRAVAETLFPMQLQRAEVYDRALDALRRRCRVDDDAFETVTTGLAALEWTCGGRFATSSARRRVSVLKEIESSPFYVVVYGELLEQLYSHAGSWSLFAAAT
jgi:hypothetical protein